MVAGSCGFSLRRWRSTAKGLSLGAGVDLAGEGRRLAILAPYQHTRTVAVDDYERVILTSRQQLRAWLEKYGADSPGIWLVTYKRSSGRQTLTYEEVVQEALCFGWIDSQVRAVDEERSMQLLTPRKPGSMWSASNKERISLLESQGLLTDAGVAAIERARADGSWSILDPVERLELPEDLAAALDATANARAGYEAYPASVKKQVLWWVISAKRPQTREARVEQIVAAAARGERVRP